MPGGKFDSDVNPFTGESIPQINSTEWHEASTTDLYKQLSVLEKRLNIARSLGKVLMINQLQQAVDSLRETIQLSAARQRSAPIKKRPNSHESTTGTKRQSE